jgi:hypothetical protein
LFYIAAVMIKWQQILQCDTATIGPWLRAPQHL